MLCCNLVLGPCRERKAARYFFLLGVGGYLEQVSVEGKEAELLELGQEHGEGPEEGGWKRGRGGRGWRG